MGFILDHVFVAVSRGGPEAETLTRAGFAEGPPNVHPGQGTACRRFFFENAYLELIWLEDGAEATAPEITPTGLAVRADVSGDASHVGICLRPSPAGPMKPPVETWAYRPPWLPEGMSIPIALSSSALHEPLLFFLPASVAPTEVGQVHPNGARRLTGIHVTVSAEFEWSAPFRWLASSGLVRVGQGDRESVTVELDDSAAGGSADVRAAVPLLLRW